MNAVLDYEAPAPRARTPRIQVYVVCFLSACSYAAFANALALPALYVDPFGNGKISSGFACLIFGFVFWPSNLLLIVSPLAALWGMRPLAGKRRRALLIGYALSVTPVLVFWTLAAHEMRIGSFFWIASHMLALAAVASAVFRSKPKLARVSCPPAGPWIPVPHHRRDPSTNEARNRPEAG